MAALKPTVLWAQREDSVFVTIDLKDTKDIDLKIEETTIAFTGTAAEKKYAFDFELFAPIVKDETKIRTTRLIEIYLKKKEADEWNKLNKEGKLNYVKIDWNKWADDDEPAEAFDMDGMGGMGGMPGMGGMGGMPGMGGMGGMPGMGGMGGMPGMESMMGGMGGMPGMGGMDFSQMMQGMNLGGGAEGGGDSDDEDLPDLDEPVNHDEEEGEKVGAGIEEVPDASVGA